MKRKLVLAILLILIFALSAMVAYGSTPTDHLRVNGIDISPFNGEIDWDKAKADGVEFAFIRIGGQYYGEKGGHYFDDSLKANYDGAKSSDIMVGGYFFSQAITVEEAIKEAEESHNYIIENGINPSDFELPFFIDRELIADDDGPGRLKAANLSVEQELEIELAFCNRLRELGYESGLYAYLDFLDNNTDSTVLSDLGYPIWVAQYNDECQYEKLYNLWQFTESGTIAGIGAPTDRDYWYINKSLKPNENSNFTLDKCSIRITQIPSYVGTNVIPKFNVYDNDILLKADVDYKIIGYIDNNQPGTGYVILHGLGSYKGYRAIPFSVTSTLGVPSEIEIGNVPETGKIEFSWNAAPGASEYVVERSVSNNSNYELLTVTDKTSVIDADTVAGTTYYYRVKAVNGIFLSDWVYEYQTCDLASPTITIGNVPGTGKVKLTWSPIEGATSYEIYRSAGNDSNYVRYTSTTETSYVNESTISGITYYYKVRAIYGDKPVANSAWGYEYQTCDLAKPVIKIGNVESTGKVRLSWAKIDRATGYEIYRSVGNDYNYVKHDTVLTESYTDNETKAGTTYYYRVRAIHSSKPAANSAWGYEYQTCDLGTPKITISNIPETGKVKLSWNPIEGATSYEIYRSAGNNSNYVRYTSTTGTTYINESTLAGITYYYKVRALYADKPVANSAWGYEYQTCDLAKPTITVSGTKYPGKVYVSWNKVDRADKYIIYRSSSENGTYTQYSTTTRTTYLNESVTKGKRYYYKIIAVYSSKPAANSSYSNIDYATVR